MNEYFVYRLCPANEANLENGFINLMRRGEAGLLLEEQTLRCKSGKALFRSVGRGEPKYVNELDVFYARQFNAFNAVAVPMVRRQLNVRTEWSKK